MIFFLLILHLSFDNNLVVITILINCVQVENNQNLYQVVFIYILQFLKTFYFFSHKAFCFYLLVTCFLDMKLLI